MTKIKQFKIARRLGVPLFSKCENPKFSLAPKVHGKGGRRFKQQSEYALQLLEKQKARFSYGLREKQFSNYVKSAMNKRGVKATEELFVLLETRLDNVVFRLGLANTRRFARQLVSHGHITVNGRKVTIPSYHIKKGEIIEIREGSKAKSPFQDLVKKMQNHRVPVWLTFDQKKNKGTVEGVPATSEQKDGIFDLTSVIEFYSR